MTTLIQKRSGSIGGLARVSALFILLLCWGMMASVSAEPLLSVEESFADTDRPPDATMLIEVREYAEPAPEATSSEQPQRDVSPAPAPELSDQTEMPAVPEPSSLVLAALGILAVWGFRKRLKQ